MKSTFSFTDLDNQSEHEKLIDEQMPVQSVSKGTSVWFITHNKI